jgi:hypothetical protein
MVPETGFSRPIECSVSGRPISECRRWDREMENDALGGAYRNTLSDQQPKADLISLLTLGGRRRILSCSAIATIPVRAVLAALTSGSPSVL